MERMSFFIDHSSFMKVEARYSSSSGFFGKGVRTP